MDISRYEVEITRHALQQARHRGIDPQLIQYVLRQGTVEQFGKHGIKFICTGAKRTIICVGHCIGTRIRIFTITEGA